MEVAVPLPVQDFHFDSACTSLYVSAPSSPKRLSEQFDLFRHYTSAPTSPTRASAIYAHFDASGGDDHDDAAPGGVPFDWEEKPGTPKSRGSPAKDDVFDFAFGFGGHHHREGSAVPVLITADELFEEGMIRPLKPPPRLQYPSMDDRSSVACSPQLPKPRGRWSPQHRRATTGENEFDPFAAALVEATRDTRERTPAPPAPRKASRSLSPLRSFFKRASDSPPASTAASPATSKSISCGGSKKWRLRDLLLFRSASEGRKYTLLSSSKKVVAEDVKNSSFRSTDSSGGGSARRSNGNGRLSYSHELHYAATRAVAAEELKKKTALPYREGLFGCLRFNPAVLSLSRGFNSHSFGRR